MKYVLKSAKLTHRQHFTFIWWVHSFFSPLRRNSNKIMRITNRSASRKCLDMCHHGTAMFKIQKEIFLLNVIAQPHSSIHRDRKTACARNEKRWYIAITWLLLQFSVTSFNLVCVCVCVIFCLLDGFWTYPRSGLINEGNNRSYCIFSVSSHHCGVANVKAAKAIFSFSFLSSLLKILVLNVFYSDVQKFK